MLKAIVLDIDGTLLDDEKEISQRTKEALIQAQENGVKLILASGRPVSGMMKYVTPLQMDQHHGLLVSYNGARVVDCMTNETLYNETMSIRDAQAVLEHLKKFDVKVMIDKDDYMYVNDVFNNTITYKNAPFNIIQYESRGGHFKLCEIDDLAAFADFPLNKILTAGEPDYLKEHHQEMMAPFKGRLHCVFTADFYFEFTAKGIDKAKALKTVLTPLGIDQEHVVAFGDGHNDISMMQYAGLGVAMDNAVAELKAAADHVTHANTQDGIAVFLEDQFFPFQ